MSVTVYKILDSQAWSDALEAGVFRGAPVDLADGFIHLSAADQVRETALRHFAGRAGLVLISFDAESLGSQLKWEPSRGGALFPHYYGNLDPFLASEVRPLPIGPDGGHVFPDDLS